MAHITLTQPGIHDQTHCQLLITTSESGDISLEALDERGESIAFVGLNMIELLRLYQEAGAVAAEVVKATEDTLGRR